MGPAGAPESERSWRRLLPQDAALNLAVFRIAVGALFLATFEVRTAASWASLPASLAVTPRGWGWALQLLPASPGAARVAAIILSIGAILGVLGCFARVAFASVTLSALYVLALPLRNGLPYHYQHLVWFSALCAVSPCADALSLDAWRRRRRPPIAAVRSAMYGLPIRIAWLLLGAIFFFPGVWKLRGPGTHWITGDNLRNQMYWKWAITPGLVPPFRIDRLPALLHACALGVVLLELAFPFAVWHRSLRVAAVLGALAFHAGARQFMGIDFSGLWLTYVVFVDWEALRARWRARTRAATASAPHGEGGDEAEGSHVRGRALAPVLVLGAVLLTGAIEAGARGATSGWPFACYPTFREEVGTSMPVLAASVIDREGHEAPVDLLANTAASEVPRERSLGLRLLAGATPARFTAYWERIAARVPMPVGEARAVRFYAGELSTVPEDRQVPPRRLKQLHELALELPPP